MPFVLEFSFEQLNSLKSFCKIKKRTNGTKSGDKAAITGAGVVVFSICFVVVVAGIVSVFTGDFVPAVVVVSMLFSMDSSADNVVFAHALEMIEMRRTMI